MTTYNVMSGSNMYIDTVKNCAYIMKATKIDKLDLSTNHHTLLNYDEWLREGENPQLFTNEDGYTWEVNSYGIKLNRKENGEKEFQWINKNPGQPGRENNFAMD